jgi:hypothetical protein
MDILKEIFYDIDDQVLTHSCIKNCSDEPAPAANKCIFIDLTACGYGVIRRYYSLCNIKEHLSKFNHMISKWINSAKKNEIIDPTVIKWDVYDAERLINELDKYLKPRNSGSITNLKNTDLQISNRFCYEKLNNLKDKIHDFMYLIQNIRVENIEYSELYLHYDCFKRIRFLILDIVESDIENELKRLLEITEEDRRSIFKNLPPADAPHDAIVYLNSKIDTSLKSLKISRKGNMA